MLQIFGIVAFIAMVGNRLVDALIAPLFEKFKWDKFWILYVAWAVTTPLVLLTGANLFETYIESAIVGKILTGIVAGGGANLLHDLFDQKPKASG